jgi:coatomer subunit gamma
LVDASEADEFLEVASKPLESLPYDSPGQTFVAFEKPEGVIATGKFSNILKFFVKEVCVLLAAPHLIFFYVHFV